MSSASALQAKPTRAAILLSLLGWHFPKVIAEMIAKEWFDHETNTKRLKTLLNPEIVAGGPGIREFWFGSLNIAFGFYCPECGGHKSKLLDEGRFRNRCKGCDETSCREVKFTVCDCHDCSDCIRGIGICRGYHRQCRECVDTYRPSR